MIENQEFIQDFVDDSLSNIEIVESLLLKEEKIRKEADTINSIFRSVHSIKGTAGFFGLKTIVSLSHSMENLFSEIRNNRISFDQEIADIMIICNDKLKELVSDVYNSLSIDISEYVTQLDNIYKSKKTLNNETLTLYNKANKRIEITGSNYDILVSNLKYGHNIYEIYLNFNNDQKLSQNPIKFINNIFSIGSLIESYIDHHEVANLDDLIYIIEGKKDVILKLLITTVLSKDILAIELEIPESFIDEFYVLKKDTKIPSNTLDSDIESKPKSTNEQNDSNLIPIENSQDNQHNLNETKDNSKNVKIDDTLKVHVTVLNELLNLASEMVLGRNQLLRMLDDQKKNIPGLSSLLQNIDRMTSLLQSKIMLTRMQPVGNVFNKFPRIIRNLSKTLDKEIQLILEGEEVELDKSVIEGLSDPLTHLVRNSADHGLETPNERMDNNKSKVGTIKLKAYHEGGFVKIDISDDGRGIDNDKISQKAIETGLVKKDDIDRMSNQEILNLILAPGFSTADKISDISGRGVGMDVVRENIEKLNGTIEIFTEKGYGSTMRLILPLTIAIIQSLIVEVNNQRFAVSQMNLNEVVRIKHNDLQKHIEYIHNYEVLRLRDKLLPIVRLSNILNIESTTLDSNITIILVLQVGTRCFGLIVDKIYGSEETLVKPLPTSLKICDCYSGVTIMGDGKIAMILDLEGLIRISNLKFRSDNFDKQLDEIEKESNIQNLLIFKCSGNEFYSINLSKISRVEEINTNEIELIGRNEYFKFNNEKVRIIHPEDYLPVNSSSDYNNKSYLILPFIENHHIAILAKKIIDNVSINLELNNDPIKTQGITGTFIYENKIIQLIDIDELLQLAIPEIFSTF